MFLKRSLTIPLVLVTIVAVAIAGVSVSALFSNLQKALEEAREPKLSNWNGWLQTSLGVRDISNTTDYTPRRLYIQGEVWNGGNGTAYDCKLQVKLYQNERLKYEVYIELGNIASDAIVQVDENIVYSGDQHLSSWDIQPVFSKPS